MLVTLAEAKAYLGIPALDTTYDAFLTTQIEIISNSIEVYLQRKLEQGNYVQTFYREDFTDDSRKFEDPKDLFLAHFPLISITSIVDQDAVAIEGLRIHKESGALHLEDGFFNNCREEAVVTFVGGYAVIPPVIKSVVFSLLEEKYAKKLRGVGMSFGSDVQSISIPGAISISFDYTLQANDLSSDQGMILGNYLNVLARFRSEKAIIGSIRKEYV